MHTSGEPSHTALVLSGCFVFVFLFVVGEYWLRGMSGGLLSDTSSTALYGICRAEQSGNPTNMNPVQLENKKPPTGCVQGDSRKKREVESDKLITSLRAQRFFLPWNRQI